VYAGREQTGYPFLGVEGDLAESRVREKQIVLWLAASVQMQ
jgi:hypothetical protein